MKLNFNQSISYDCYLAVAFLCFSSCITPLDQEPSAFEPYLVIEGFIDDDFGPHQFNITEVASFAGVLSGGEISFLDAQVEIIDQNGVRTPVERQTEKRKSLYDLDPPACVPASDVFEITTPYRTPTTFKGEIGNTYTLEITVRGKTYRSQSQTMLATPPIDSILLDFKELPSLNDIIRPTGIELSVRFQDPADETNYYTWIIDGIYQISSPNKPPPACCIYDPDDGGVENCWIMEKRLKNTEIAFSDEKINGQIATVAVGFIEDDGLRFASRRLPSDKKYFAEIKQYQIDEPAFDFFNTIKTLGEIDGEIFDPLPLSVRGNINNVNDPEEIVIGYFGAFSVQKKEVFIPESIIEFKQRYTYPCGDCRTRKGAQVVTPEPFM